MHIAPFSTEDFFARYEFSAPHMLSGSDCEHITVAELCALAHQDLADLGHLALHYTEASGNEGLRRAIAATHERIDPEHVLVLNAPQEGIFLAMHALLEPGDDVVVLSPCYDSLAQVAEHIGCTVHRWALRACEDGAWWELDWDALDALLEHAPHMVVVNVPHNPTGFLPDRETWTRLLERCREAGALVFSDEMYRGLELWGADQLPSAVDLIDGAVTLTGLSKSFGLPGLRSGWLVVPDDALRAKIASWKHYTTICAPAPVEWLTERALHVRHELWAGHRARVERNVAHMEAMLSRHPELSWRRPQGASTALVHTPYDDVVARCHRWANEHGVVVLPGVFLGAPADTVRVGLGRDAFAQALGVFEAALGKVA